MNKAKPYVAKIEELQQESFDWGTLQWLCNDRLSPGAQQTVGICQILAGKSNPVHYHPNCEEVLFILAGEGRHSFDGESVALRTGQAMRIPAGVRHNLAN